MEVILTILLLVLLSRSGVQHTEAPQIIVTPQPVRTVGPSIWEVFFLILVVYLIYVLISGGNSVV